MMQLATWCILRVCWVPASQDRTYPVPLWAYSSCPCPPLGVAWDPDPYVAFWLVKIAGRGSCIVGMTRMVQYYCSLRLAALHSFNLTVCVCSQLNST